MAIDRLCLRANWCSYVDPLFHFFIFFPFFSHFFSLFSSPFFSLIPWYRFQMIPSLFLLILFDPFPSVLSVLSTILRVFIFSLPFYFNSVLSFQRFNFVRRTSNALSRSRLVTHFIFLLLTSPIIYRYEPFPFPFPHSLPSHVCRLSSSFIFHPPLGFILFFNE